MAMKGVWKWSLSLALGLLTCGAWADEVQWRPASGSGTPPASVPVGAAIASQWIASPPGQPRPLPVSFDKPIPTVTPTHAAISDPQVRPVTFSMRTPSGRNPSTAPISVRAQIAESARVMPQGAPLLDPEPLRMPTPTPGLLNVPPGTVVLPYGTILPPGGVLPPNVIIAPVPIGVPGAPPSPVAPSVPAVGASTGTVMPGPPSIPQPGDLMVPSMASGDGAPIPDMPFGPVETVAPSYEVATDECGDGEVNCGDPGVCCVTAESCCDCCPCECCCCCPNGCYAKERFYVSADYLAWWVKGNPAPPLVTTSNALTRTAGNVDDPTTSVLFGGGDVSKQFRQGVRATAGFWLTDSQCLGVEGSVLFLPRSSNNFNASSPGEPGLFRPLLFTSDNANHHEVVAFTGPNPNNADVLKVAGGINVKTSNDLWGAEANLRSRLLCGSWYRVTLLGGFRYLGMEDRLDIFENPTTFFKSGVPPSTTTVNDSFRTGNNFYGGNLGAETELKFGKFIVDMRGKCALGVNTERIDVAGSTVIGSNSFPAGILAQSSNIGTHRSNRFAVVPEGDLNIGYQLTDWCRVYAGYTFLYWSNVVRTGDQVDLRIDPKQIPKVGVPYNYTAQHPMVPFKTTDFWAQGVNFGMQLQW
jgi:hypothetical protein